MKKIIKKGEKIPMFYGIAYLNLDSLTAICYPLPLNILIGSLRKIYFHFVSGWDFKSGYDRGWIKGKQDGERYVFNLIKEQVIKNNLEEILRRFLDYGEKMFEARRQGENITGWMYEFIEKETKKLKRLT